MFGMSEVLVIDFKSLHQIVQSTFLLLLLGYQSIKSATILLIKLIVVLALPEIYRELGHNQHQQTLDQPEPDWGW